MNDFLLDATDIHAGYGASRVLFDFNLQVRAGEVVTLLGRNGVGKTTTLRTLLGLNRITRGSIHFCGQRIDHLATDRIARLGIAIVPEGRQIFPNLTVKENLVAFADVSHSSRWNLQTVYALFPRLQERAQHMGNHLSGGEQQMLAIGRALMRNPHLLILDEATEGLSPLIREEIWRCLRQLREQGQSIIIVDKYVDRLIPFADRHTIVEKGRVVWHGTSAELQAQPELWQRWLGV